MTLDSLPYWADYLSAQLRYLADAAAFYSPNSPRSNTPDEFAAWQRTQDELSERRGKIDALMAHVLSGLRPTDVEAILDRSDGDDLPMEQRPGMFILNDLVRANDARFEPEQRHRWGDLLERKFRFGYPAQSSPYLFLRWLDAERADRLLLEFLANGPIDQLSGKEMQTILRDLRGMGSRALAPLRRLTERQGPIAVEAAKTLERMGHPSAARLDEVAAEWRRTKTRETLNWLYEAVVIHVKEGEPAAPILALLGEPSQTFPDMYTWETTEPEGQYSIALNLHVSAQGAVTGFKLK